MESFMENKKNNVRNAKIIKGVEKYDNTKN